jgi:hypothetical protein
MNEGVLRNGLLQRGELKHLKNNLERFPSQILHGINWKSWGKNGLSIIDDPWWIPSGRR